MIKSARFSAALLGVSHFLVDFACAMLISQHIPAHIAALCVIIYNGLAFAFQLPLGALADRLQLSRVLSCIGCLTVAAGCNIRSPLALCIIIGLGNACFHIGGGREVLAKSGNRFAPVGRFVAPGALGIFFGPYMAKYMWISLVCMALLAACALLLFLGRHPLPSPLGDEKDRFSRREILACACFFLTVFLRSYMGTVPQYGFESWAATLFTFCIFGGKFFGGSLADRFGSLHLTVVAQPMGTVLFALSVWQPILAIPAIFIFNTTMAITAARLSQLAPNFRGTMFGLTTFALFLGVLPKLIGLATPFFTWWGLGGISLLSTLLLATGLALADREARHG